MWMFIANPGIADVQCKTSYLRDFIKEKGMDL